MPCLSPLHQCHVLTQVDSLSYLGVKVDDSMNFNAHISNVCSKIARALNVFKQCKILPSSVMIKIYNAIVLPHFDYCATVWGTTSQANFTRLQRLQNRAMRLILKAPFTTHIDDLLTELKWMSVRQRVVFNQLVFVWKILNGFTPSYMSANVSYVKETHTRLTRSASDDLLFIPAQHRKSFYLSAFKLWNKLPFNVRKTMSVDVFKKHCTSFIFANVPKF